MEQQGVQDVSPKTLEGEVHNETNLWKTTLGIALCLAAISIASAGIVLQRKSSLVEGTRSQRRFAFCGIVFMLLSAAPDVWAWALAPQVLVASIYSCRTIPVSLLGHVVLKERLFRSDWISLLITIAGSVLSVASGPRVTDSTAKPQESIKSGKISKYIVAGSFILLLDCVTAHVLLWRRKGNSLGWALRSSLIFLAAYVFVFEKVFNTLAGRDYDVNKSISEQASDYYSEVVAVAMLGLFDLYAQIIALRAVPVHIFDTSRTAIVQLLVLLQGGIIFDEFANLGPLSIFFTFFGVFIALTGSALMQGNADVRKLAQELETPAAHASGVELGMRRIPLE